MIEKVIMSWIKHIRKEIFSRRSERGTSKLNIKSDENAVYRCYRRLTPRRQTSIQSTYQRRITRLVITDHHERLFHAETSHKLSYMRRTCWILLGRTEVRSVLLKCGVCLKCQGAPFKIPKCHLG